MHSAELNLGFLLRCIFAGAVLFNPQPVSAFQFSNTSRDISGSFDTTISFGLSWRTQDPDSALVGISNGGTARSNNEDDGDLNFRRGNLFSAAVKATHEFDLKYKNYGFFTRVSYFYDERADQNDALGPLARDRAVSDAKVLDFYGRGSFDLGGRKLNLRLGNQVVSWGESTFIQNGINIINPIDVSRLRVPGAELKEALTPSTILWLSQEISDKATVEGFWITDFNKTLIDPRGTFFSANDFISDDGDRVFVGFGRRNDQHGVAGLFGVPPNVTQSAFAPRSNDRDLQHERNQWGLALRLFAPQLNDTEIGLYYVNYHSRIPMISGIRGAATVGGVTPVGIATCGVASKLINLNVLFPGNNPLGQFPCLANAIPLVQGTYFAEYPENIHLYGLSFNTQIAGGVALQGEYSYRPNFPLQLSSTELLLAALGLPNNITGTAPGAAGAVRPGTEITGFRRVEMHQIQMTATKAFGPTLGAQQFTALGELGYTYLNLPNGLLFNGPATHLPAPGSFTGASNGSVQPGGEGYATRGSWGYRLSMRLDFTNAIGPATLSPRLAFSHDVRGVSPTFNQGTKALTLGLGINYLEKWQADLSYTNFFDGRTYSGRDPAGVAALTAAGQSTNFASSANPLKDRDFISLSISYSF